MNRPKRMDQNDESNSASSSSKRRRQDKSNESSDIAGGSNIGSTGQSGKIEKSTPIQIENLPTDILIKIIGLLPVAQWSALERVHPNMRDVVYTAWGSLKKIDIPRDLLPRQQIRLDGEKKFHDKMNAVMEKLVNRAPNLIDIAVGCSKIETVRCPRFIMAQLVRFEKLQRIDFGKDCFTTSGLKGFLSKSASRDQLREIVNICALLRPAYFNNDHLSAAFDNSNYNDKQLRLETINFGLPSTELPLLIPGNFLETIDVSRLTTFRVMNSDIPQRVLADFLDRTPQLRQLSFDFGCYYTQGGNLHQPAANAVETVLDANKRIISAVARMEGLESLIIGSSIYYSLACACGDFGQQLTGLLITLGQRPSFKELGLVGQLTKAGFMNHVAAAIPNVESLRLEMNDLTTPILDAIFLPRSDLRKLHVSSRGGSVGSSQFGSKYIMQNASTLESLSLDLTSKTFSVDYLKALGGLTKLRELKLDSLNENMDDAVLEAWGNGFGGTLTKLEIRSYGYPLTGDAAVIEKAPNLKTLIIRNYSINDGCLERMAALSPKIEEFGLECSKISKIALQHVVDGFRQLKKFSLSNIDWRPKEHFDLDFGKYRVVNFCDTYN